MTKTRALGAAMLLSVGLSCRATLAQIPTRTKSTPEKPAAQLPVTSQTPQKPGEAFPDLQKRLSDAIEKRDLAQALAIAELQHRLYPTELKATADLGSVLLMQGDAVRAEPILRQATEQQNKFYKGDPSQVRGDVFAALGKIALDRKQPKEAIGYLQHAVDNSPTAARPRFLLAKAFVNAGDNQRGLQELRAAFNIDDTVAGTVDYVLLAETERATGKLDAALKSVEMGIERFPMNPDLRIERALVQQTRKKPAEAVYDLLYARMLVGKDAPQEATIAAQLRQVQALTESSATDPDPELERVFSYLDDAAVGQHEQGLESLLEAIRINGRDPFVPRLLLATSYRHTGRFASAEQMLTKLVEQDSYSVPAMLALADLYFAEGRNERARALLQRAATLDPQNAQVRQIQAAWTK